MSRELKPAQAADRETLRRAAEADAAGRAWWRRVPQLVIAPRGVFEALRETDELDMSSRSEPLLAITTLAATTGLLLTPAWGTLMDERDAIEAIIVTFLAALLYGAFAYFVLGLAIWIGARAVGLEVPFKLARQLVGFSALPLALGLAVVLPAILIGFGGDWFRSGGSDEGAAGAALVAVGLAFAVWAIVLVAVGLRTTFRLSWQGAVGALSLAVVMVAAVAVLPSVL